MPDHRRLHEGLLKRPGYAGLAEKLGLIWDCRTWPPRVWRGAYRLQQRALSEFRGTMKRDLWRLK